MIMKLNSGYEIPNVGLGTWKADPGQVGLAVEAALDAGYKHIDCAWVYFNEKEIGEAIKKKVDDGTIKREELFVTTKLWNTFHQPADVKDAFMKSLTDLGLDYIDLYLIHFPVGFTKDGDNQYPMKDGKLDIDPVDYVETWKALEKLQKEGLVRSIGVSNFNWKQIERIMKTCEITPAMNQIEIHPFFGNDEEVEWCQKNGIAVTAYSPFGSPDRRWATKDEKTILSDPRVITLAEKYGKNVGQIVLRYLLQRNLIVIPKSVTASRIAGNLKISDFELSSEDFDIIAEMNTRKRFTWPTVGVPGLSEAKYFPFPEGEYNEGTGF